MARLLRPDFNGPSKLKIMAAESTWGCAPGKIYYGVAGTDEQTKKTSPRPSSNGRPENAMPEFMEAQNVVMDHDLPQRCLADLTPYGFHEMVAAE